MKLTFRTILFLTALATLQTATARKPQLVVNIIVGSMRATDLDRYNDGFGDNGFRRLMREGTRFTECYADYLPTSTEAGLATLSTGALPSAHGVVSPTWYDRNNGDTTDLGRNQTPNRDYYPSINGIDRTHLNDHLAAQTLSEAILDYSVGARVVTIAHNGVSAVMTAGKGGECYWLDTSGNWVTGDCYTKELPAWVQNYNGDGLNRSFIGGKWYGKYTKEHYINANATDITLYEAGAKIKPAKAKEAPDAVKALLTTPAGNVAIFEFAKRALQTMLPHKAGDGCRVLNICLDTPRHIARKYGPESAEYEDMLYCLDSNLADFLTQLYSLVAKPEEVVVTLTSPHGSSPLPKGKDTENPHFNARQFEVITNAFLSARYGQESWVLAHNGTSLYLDHNVIYRKGKSVAEIEAEVAKFALQFRGVAYAVPASSLQGQSFGCGVARLIQNGYYPRRSGDVVVALMQGRIADEEGVVSASGSHYNYDRHVPLIICGGGAAKGKSVARRITTERIAPTVAHMLGVARPSASDAEIIEETE